MPVIRKLFGGLRTIGGGSAIFERFLLRLVLSSQDIPTHWMRADKDGETGEVAQEQE